MKKLESGRSMIEMLGVLAIIGVLSIGGLAGYTMAMNRYRANQVSDYVARCMVVAQTKGLGDTIETSKDCKALLDDEPYPQGIDTANAKPMNATGTVMQPAVIINWDANYDKVEKAFESRYSTDNKQLPHLNNTTTYIPATGNANQISRVDFWSIAS